jgi:hypothetical protein
MDPLQRFLRGVSEQSMSLADDYDDDLDERPAEGASAPRKRRSRDRSFKKTNRSQFYRTPRSGR